MTKSFSLSVADVSKSFGPTRAVIDVSLDFRAGEIHGLIGENGSGKSTLLSMIAGIHTRDKGRCLKGPALRSSEPRPRQ